MGYIDNNNNYNAVGRKIDTLKTEEGYLVPALLSSEILRRFPAIVRNYVKLFGDANQYKVVINCVGYATYEQTDFKLYFLHKNNKKF